MWLELRLKYTHIVSFTHCSETGFRKAHSKLSAQTSYQPLRLQEGGWKLGRFFPKKCVYLRKFSDFYKLIMCSETQYVAGFLLWLCPNTQWQWHTRTRTMYSSLPLFSPYSSSTSPVQLCRHGSGASPVKLNLVSYGISLYLYLLFATGFQITYCEIY